MKMINIAKLRLKIYFSTPDFIIPAIAMIVFCAVMYTIKPVYFVGSILVTSVFVFYLTAFISLAYTGKENEVNEQLMYLIGKNIISYELSKHIFLATVDVLCGLILVGIPLLQNVINGFDLFIYPLTARDTVSSLLIVISSAICGGVVGAFFNGRVIEKKDMGILLTVLVLVVSTCKVSLIEKYLACRFVLWVFPSVMLSNSIFAEAEYFELIKSLGVCAALLLYSSVFVLLKIVIMKFRRVSK